MHRAILFFTILLSACGYRFSCSENPDPITISVPYIKGDPTDGKLTDAIARAISTSSRFLFVSGHSMRRLKVVIVQDEREKIGYRYDRHAISGKLKHNLVPTEGRRIIRAEVTLLDGIADEIMMGPVIVTASSEFDYVNSDNLHDLTFFNNGKLETVLNFSLGQLDSIEGAEDNALDPLYTELAEKIADGLMREIG